MRETAAETENFEMQSMKKGASAKKIAGVIGKIFWVILGTLAVLIFRSVIWVLKTWNNLSMEEIVYHLKMPLEGTNDDIIWDYIFYCAVAAALAAVILTCLLILTRKKKKIYRVLLGAVPAASVLMIALSVNHIWTTLDVSAYVKNQNTYSSFIDDNYVDPASVDISFPEQKRNLIYIYLESMENTYADQQSGGAFEKNVIPELTQLSLENENFSGEESILNGGYALTGTTWTVGAMFGQTSALPLLIPIEKNSMDTQEDFFPGITTLGDILDDQGYRQELLIGSDAEFGGRKLYFEQHGGYEIYDYYYSKNHGEIPEDYYVWWGYEDERLFEHAKERLNELSASSEPFNLTLLTVDTHFEDGYVCGLCTDEFGDDQYSNVMACSSRQVSEFVRWIQEQPFYENTTIVISGDHLTMDVDYCENVSADYERKVYTAYINAPVSPETDTYREYSTFDAFPTTLASLGAEIEGDRLGLGVNLYSSKETLVEQYGVESVNEGLSQKSALMEELSSSINKADVSAIEYDSAGGSLSLTAENIQWDQEIRGVECQVRLGQESQEILYYSGDPRQEDSYYIEIPLSDFGSQPGIYYVDTYLQLEDGKKELLKSDSIEIKDETENTEETNPAAAAVISTIPYDFQTGKFTVEIGGTFSDDIIGIKCAVWAEEDQSDLLWYDAVNAGENNYTAEVYGVDFNYKNAVYNIHVYGVNGENALILLGACQETISS